MSLVDLDKVRNFGFGGFGGFDPNREMTRFPGKFFFYKTFPSKRSTTRSCKNSCFNSFETSMTFASFLCAVDLVDLEHNTFGGFGRFSEDLVDLAKRWIWTFAPNPPPRLYKTRKVDLDSVTEKLSKTLEVDLVDLNSKFAKTPKVDLKGFEHRCDIWRSRRRYASFSETIDESR